LKNLKGGILASIGTDGIDGNTDAAGAIGDEKVLEKAREKGYEIDSFLENNNSHEFLKECGGLIKSGNTGTNVADICVYLRERKN
jgi:hydroxypyruvate reductase/glycerate 2-kinase